MNSIKVFFARVCSGSFKRMNMYIKEIKKESGQLSIVTFFDMLWCIFRYGIGYLEYRVFGFCYIKGSKKRLTFINMKDSLKMVSTLNSKEYTHFLSDKLDFNENFSEYLGRKFINLKTATKEEFFEFIDNCEVVFCKVTDNFGGQGIERVVVSEIDDKDEFYNSCIQKKQFDVEEAVVQNEKMSTLNPTSINTIRIVTIFANGEAHLMYSLLRIGNGKSCVDNISSGGMYVPVNEDGVIFRRAFCDKTGMLYDSHPVTNTEFIGFEIPMFKEAVQMCKDAAAQIPEVGYVGWDVAISTNGPVFIEGNEMPGYDMCQNYYHLDHNHIGIKPKFEQVLGKDFFS